MGDIVAGSSEYKEAAERSLVKIEFLEEGKLIDSTIGVVVVSMPQHWCYVIAPNTKFKKIRNGDSLILVRVHPYNGARRIIQPQELEFSRDIVKFYLYGKDVQANEMQIGHVPPARNETIYLLCYNYVGAILQPGNVTLAGEGYLRQDCPSPYPVKEREVDKKKIFITLSGEVLLDDAGMLAGIVYETDTTDRTAAMNVIAIRGQLLINNETIDEFKERIRNAANPPPPGNL